MTDLPAAVAEAAAAFGIDAAALRDLGGQSGSSWGAGDHVLRVAPRRSMDAELAAMAAAAAVLPVPKLIDRVEAGDHSAVLVERLPGQSVADFAARGVAQARAAGLACGAVHALLAGVQAPSGLRAAAFPGPGGATGGGDLGAAPGGSDPGAATGHGGSVTPARVLHLDLHPMNILIGDDGKLTGIIDWANAHAGDPDLDRARTWSILTLDPIAVAFSVEPAFQALAESWTEAGRLHDVPARARSWACSFMLHDLGRRYSPADLAHVARARAEAEAAAANENDGQ